MHSPCAEAARYRQTLVARHEREAQTLASLTGWRLQTIRAKMALDSVPPDDDEPSWWQRLWRR